MSTFDLKKLNDVSEEIGYKKAKIELLERIQNLHKPSEIAAETIFWIKEDKPKAD